MSPLCVSMYSPRHQLVDHRSVLPAPARCARPASPSTGKVAGWPEVPWPATRIEVELLPRAETPVPFPGAFWVTIRTAARRRNETAISQRLLHQVEVAVRAAKQDVG